MNLHHETVDLRQPRGVREKVIFRTFYVDFHDVDVVYARHAEDLINRELRRIDPPIRSTHPGMSFGEYAGVRSDEGMDELDAVTDAVKLAQGHKRVVETRLRFDGESGCTSTPSMYGVQADVGAKIDNDIVALRKEAVVRPIDAPAIHLPYGTEEVTRHNNSGYRGLDAAGAAR
jgi:hypothetical protein